MFVWCIKTFNTFHLGKDSIYCIIEGSYRTWICTSTLPRLLASKTTKISTTAARETADRASSSRQHILYRTGFPSKISYVSLFFSFSPSSPLSIFSSFTSTHFQPSLTLTSISILSCIRSQRALRRVHPSIHISVSLTFNLVRLYLSLYLFVSLSTTGRCVIEPSQLESHPTVEVTAGHRLNHSKPPSYIPFLSHVHSELHSRISLTHSSAFLTIQRHLLQRCPGCARCFTYRISLKSFRVSFYTFILAPLVTKSPWLFSHCIYFYICIYVIVGTL